MKPIHFGGFYRCGYDVDLLDHDLSVHNTFSFLPERTYTKAIK